MFSNVKLRMPSLALRMLLWYIVATVSLVTASIAILYFALAFHLDSELDSTLSRDARFFHQSREYPMDDFDDWVYRPTRIIDTSSHVRAESSQMMRLFPKIDFPPPGDVGTDRLAADGHVYRLIAVCLEGWVYQQAQDRTSEIALMSRFRRNVILVALPLLILSVVTGIALARHGLHPMKRIVAAARSISPNSLADRVPTQGLPAELLELADTLNNSLNRMQEAFSRLDQFSEDVAHELRTPVHNLKVGIEVTLSNDRTPTEYKKALESSLNEVDRLSRMVDRLLFLAQAEDPRREICREPTDLASELEEVYEFFAPAASEANVALDVPKPECLQVSLDRSLFQRAVNNLVINALTHTPAGGRVRVITSIDQGYLCVAVVDTGVGISDSDLPQLFDRYFRSEAARAEGRGVGLGLAIVRRIVELHGGRVDIQSTIDIGTTVRMFIPVY